MGTALDLNPEVSGSNPFGSSFEILHFVKALLCSLSKNSKSAEESCPYVQIVFF